MQDKFINIQHDYLNMWPFYVQIQHDYVEMHRRRRISLIGGKDKNNWPKFGRRHGPRQGGKPGQM